MSTTVSDASARIRDILKRTHLFSSWPDPLIDNLMEGAELRRYVDGETALERGVSSPHLCIVASGSFVAQRPRHGDEILIADYLMPGQSISYIAALDGFPSVFDATASGESEMLFIARQTLMDVFARNPERYLDVVLMLCRQLRREFENTYMRTANSVRCQLARVILYWARGQTGDGNGARVPVGISQEDIAAMLGKSRPTINKEIGILIDEGILARSYRQIQVLDLKALMNIVEHENPGTIRLNETMFSKPDGVLKTSD
ncbi:MAG TPA: Crp/Fnr family transcriptional regulator [Rhizomicrobium sp.]|nr:Crp/Fnr family transcriptional regulator [Rhizomicrobium sp.]